MPKIVVPCQNLIRAKNNILSRACLCLQKNPKAAKSLEFWHRGRSVAGILTLVRFIVSALACRFRSRAVLELENLALRHQLNVLRRRCPAPLTARLN